MSEYMCAASKNMTELQNYVNFSEHSDFLFWKITNYDLKLEVKFI